MGQLNLSEIPRMTLKIIPGFNCGKMLLKRHIRNNDGVVWSYRKHAPINVVKATADGLKNEGSNPSAIIIKRVSCEMRLEDVCKLDRHEYTKNCELCGLKLEVFTQADNDPEYYTDIYVRCNCGEYIHFELPVN